MTRSRGIAAERADAFLRDATEFRLGSLLTEAAHPRSATLSDVARQDPAAGLAMLFDVDRDVVSTFDRWSSGPDPAELRDLVIDTLRAGGRLFFTGCGATGRLSIQLNAIWRAFWQQRRERGETSPSPDDFEHRTYSVMAGGDYALIKSVEGFEDFAPFGRRQGPASASPRATWCSPSPRGAKHRSSSARCGRRSTAAPARCSSTTTRTNCCGRTSRAAAR